MREKMGKGGSFEWFGGSFLCVDTGHVSRRLMATSRRVHFQTYKRKLINDARKGVQGNFF